MFAGNGRKSHDGDDIIWGAWLSGPISSLKGRKRKDKTATSEYETRSWHLHPRFPSSYHKWAIFSFSVLPFCRQPTMGIFLDAFIAQGDPSSLPGKPVARCCRGPALILGTVRTLLWTVAEVRYAALPESLPFIRTLIRKTSPSSKYSSSVSWDTSSHRRAS